ncbi:MAG: hypothetical protein M1833_000264 [Piccolia ochrophora]|nr:MAG: hypothetical protein M1833_000264 [Piccolia ochrophora]
MASSSSKYTSKLSQKRVLVLGGTSGMGFCVAEAALEHGATVIISGSNPTKLSKALDRLKTSYSDRKADVSGHTCDLSKPDALESNIDILLKAATEGASLDHIAFTAGDALKSTHVSEVTLEYVRNCGNVRFLAPLIVAKLAPKYLTEGPGSSITLTGGVNTDRPTPGWSVIAAYGGAGEAMTRGLAVDLKPTRVNMVSPGSVHTELFDDIPKDKLEAVLDGMRDRTTVGEVGRPEDVAEAYIYAMKDRFVTGTLLRSNGGTLLT